MGAERADTGEWGSSLSLDDQVCFALYAASRAVTAAYRPLLAELGLTYPQYLVLLVLWERGEVSVGELGAALRLDYGTLSPLLQRMAAAGLVERERQPADERSVLVRAGERGRALRRRAHRVPPAIGAATGLSPGEARRLRTELIAIADRLAGDRSP
ncbi:MarR family winged helix-turn-helix transcriptional regulator [Actinocatenispora rupis]|uniref:MarR family transcriptional regulator n=1 Tax=Actinocatenispora rupis TaxID=519421 RepID=A0A8J3NH97_9ACTN|nr:MarR family winged helix-turn-helix transcriptional regulator [Actinocatenispora rupis]GID15734.1 MarR family transcriptional regulator [Actinocatenispora rupis]